jgi:hypothetical protein
MRPVAGTQLEYTYRDKHGIIEVKSVNHKRIVFYDHFNGEEGYGNPVDFRWSTWDVHIGNNDGPYAGTIKVIRILGLEPNWEV